MGISVEASQHLGAPKGRRRVMIVEDDLDFAESLRDFLEPRGFDVRIVATAREAMTATLSFAPDFALLDINLPKDSGLGLIEPMKAVGKDMICMVMTALEDEGLTNEAARVGADGFFRKPFDANELLAALEKRFDETRKRRGDG